MSINWPATRQTLISVHVTEWLRRNAENIDLVDDGYGDVTGRTARALDMRLIQSGLCTPSILCDDDEESCECDKAWTVVKWEMVNESLWRYWLGRCVCVDERGVGRGIHSFVDLLGQ